jgi:hypothetical protein
MLRDNGGTVRAGGDHWELFPFFDGSDRKRIARTCNDIVRETTEARKWPGFPAGAVAIASNGTGDLLIFLPDPERPSDLLPGVLWWCHEGGDVRKVADSFADPLL